MYRRQPTMPVILVSLLSIGMQLFATPLLHAQQGSCYTTVFHESSQLDGCRCGPKSHCLGKTRDFRIDRTYCVPARFGVSGHRECRTRVENVGIRYSCNEEIDYYAFAGWLLKQLSCTIALAGCGASCIGTMGATCVSCLLLSGLCLAGNAFSSTNCSIRKCYVDTDSKSDLIRNVFDGFGGEGCAGAAG